MRICYRYLAFALALGVVCSGTAAPEKQSTPHAGKTETASKSQTKTETTARPQTVAELLHEFKTAKNFFRQAQTGEKLVALQDKSVIPEMVALLTSTDRAERCNAGRVLAGLGDDRGLFAVIAELKDTSPQPRKNNASHSKGSPVYQDRYYAAHMLGRIGDKRAVPALIELLHDSKLDFEAAIVLGHMGDKRAIPVLQAVLKEAQDRAQGRPAGQLDMRLWAAYGLTGLGHPDGPPILFQLLKTASTSHWVVRRHAVEALGEFKVREAVPFLIEALKDESVEVRISVATALGSLGDKTAIRALKIAAKDGNPAISSALINYKAGQPVFKAMTVHAAATWALQQLGNR